MSIFRKKMSKEEKAYKRQIITAKRRGIEWCFTYETWLKFWEDSGKFHLRGRGPHEYCMARKMDVGPYSPENCYITTQKENLNEKQVYVKKSIGMKRRNKKRDYYAHLRDRDNHPKARAVIAPDGTRYPSASMASDTVDCSRQMVAYFCRHNKNGWQYEAKGK